MIASLSLLNKSLFEAEGSTDESKEKFLCGAFGTARLPIWFTSTTVFRTGITWVDTGVDLAPDNRELRERERVSGTVELLASYSWRLLVISAIAGLLLVLIGRLQVVLIALVVTLFLTRMLSGPARFLRTHRWPPAIAAIVVLAGFIIAIACALTLFGIAAWRQSRDIGPTVTNALNDIESWLVNDSPFELEQSDIDGFRANVGSTIREKFSSYGGTIVSGAMATVEIVLAGLLGVILTFFALKDGTHIRSWAIGLLPQRHAERVARMGNRAWQTVGAYLRGAALLGVVEGAISGLTLLLVGAELALPVAGITFLLAFVPFVGAIVAGVLAVLVAISTAGVSQAIIVAVVAIIVQQLDGDLLGPVIYGKALSLHPVAVLLAIVTGTALFGIAGSILAVPVVAVAVNVTNEARDGQRPLVPHDPESG
jgi:putative heme transporter